MELDEIRRVVTEWGQGEPLVLRVWMYGSRAKGTARPDSDLDLAVELDPEVFQRNDPVSGGLATWWAEDDRWEEELDARIHLSVHLQWYGPNDVRVGPAVREYGILLYEKGRA
jgi:predicted nucleotidyltransferase